MNKKHTQNSYNNKDYMSKEKSKNDDLRPVSQEEFDKMLIIALNTPPRKRNKKDRKN